MSKLSGNDNKISTIDPNDTNASEESLSSSTSPYHPYPTGVTMAPRVPRRNFPGTFIDKKDDLGSDFVMSKRSSSVDPNEFDTTSPWAPYGSHSEHSTLVTSTDGTKQDLRRAQKSEHFTGEPLQFNFEWSDEEEQEEVSPVSTTTFVGRQGKPTSHPLVLSDKEEPSKYTGKRSDAINIVTVRPSDVSKKDKHPKGKTFSVKKEEEEVPLTEEAIEEKRQTMKKQWEALLKTQETLVGIPHELWRERQARFQKYGEKAGREFLDVVEEAAKSDVYSTTPKVGKADSKWVDYNDQRKNDPSSEITKF